MTLDEPLRRAFERLTERLYDDIRRDVQIAVDEALAVASSRSTGSRIGQRLLDSVRSLARARSLGETLDTLAGCAAHEAGRAAVLTVRDGRAYGWRFIGFGPLDREPHVDISLDEAGVIAHAVRANTVASGEETPGFAGLPHGASCVALPIALAGEVVAVLYVDAGAYGSESRLPTGESRIPNPESRTPSPESRIPNPESRVLNAGALEILTQYAARSIEAITAFRVARSFTADSTVLELHA